MNFFELLILIIVSAIACLIVSSRIISSKNNLRMIENLPQHLNTLEYFLKKAYDIIYKDDLLIFSIEATRVNDEQLNEITKKYMILVEKILGRNLCNFYSKIFGTRDTFLFYIADYFISTYEEDEIRKKAVENIMESEITTPTEETQG